MELMNMLYSAVVLQMVGLAGVLYLMLLLDQIVIYLIIQMHMGIMDLLYQDQM